MWPLEKLEAEAAWQQGLHDAGVVVGILDSRRELGFAGSLKPLPRVVDMPKTGGQSRIDGQRQEQFLGPLPHENPTAIAVELSFATILNVSSRHASRHIALSKS